MNTTGNRYKKIAYNYDLVSGKVNQVIYQPDYFNTATSKWIKPADQFIHRYQYDAENRLTEVAVSADSTIWERIAQYHYYRHGPLATTVYGQQQVQSVTNAYTLQGWIKGIVPGNDVNPMIARQAFNYNLNYYTGDYKAIGAAPFSEVTVADFKSLYNGNIAAMLVDLPKVGGKQLHTYRYDQLHRIKEVNNYTNYNAAANSWQATDAHRERLNFDANGNIQTALLNGNEAALPYENFTYHYDAANPNRLMQINNSVSNATYNYEYDETGNVTKDELEGNSSLLWDMHGKLVRILKTDGTTVDYTYDATGNRISKKVVSGGVEKYTWYVRDASGNMVTSYIKEAGVNDNRLTMEAANIYGSTLLGRWKLGVDTEIIPDETAAKTFRRGEQEYFVSNHLGNNFLVLSDRKHQYSTDGTTVEYYEADIIGATDYSAYGENLLGRQYNSSLIQFGFNGKLNDADAGYQDYGFRNYSQKARRFNQEDPLTEEYPWYTPYQFAGNKTIEAIDLDGAEEAYINQQSQVKLRIENDIKQSEYEKETAHMWLTGAVYKKEETTVSAVKETYKTKFQQWREDNRRKNLHRLNGMDEDGNDLPITKLAKSKTFQRLDKNIVQPVATAATISSGAGSVRAIVLKVFTKGAAKTSSNLWKVGSYGELQGLEAGLQAHHVGQKSLMSRLVPGYNPANAPSILVPEIGHVTNMPGIGRVAATRGLGGFTNARQVLARDIFELRRVYGSQGIPNSSLQQLIQMNKTMYPGAFIK